MRLLLAHESALSTVLCQVHRTAASWVPPGHMIVGLRLRVLLPRCLGGCEVADEGERLDVLPAIV